MFNKEKQKLFKNLLRCFKNIDINKCNWYNGRIIQYFNINLTQDNIDDEFYEEEYDDDINIRIEKSLSDYYCFPNEYKLFIDQKLVKLSWLRKRILYNTLKRKKKLNLKKEEIDNLKLTVNKLNAFIK